MIDGKIRHNRRRNNTALRFSSDGGPEVTYKCKLDDEEFINCELIANFDYPFHCQSYHMVD